MSKKLEKAYNNLDLDTVKELESLDSFGLKNKIAQANEAMRSISEELESNPKYAALREDLKSLSMGKRDVDKRQKSVILVALNLLNNRI